MPRFAARAELRSKVGLGFGEVHEASGVCVSRGAVAQAATATAALPLAGKADSRGRGGPAAGVQTLHRPAVHLPSHDE